MSARCVLLVFWQELTGEGRERPEATLVFNLIVSFHGDRQGQFIKTTVSPTFKPTMWNLKAGF
ncbi:MAG: hypothetical protein IKQ72_10515 [Bacteroidaceae bacterium]|nr:hypothetical protein [Bacteroidaceae bacterium]